MRANDRASRGANVQAHDKEAPQGGEVRRDAGVALFGGRQAVGVAGPVQMLASQRVRGNRATSAMARARAGEPSTAQIHAGARAGIGGPGGRLPFLAAIQRSFGRHDVSHVQAHTGRAATEGARAMGAIAFATGDHVAFAGSPDLHVAAHEAAHVVQQRGGVQLKRGVGEVGDVHERHADAVADRVVRGESAEGLLDGYVGDGGPRAAAAGAPVQRRVGFEFEAQWNVRERATAEENEAAELAFHRDRDEKIEARVKELNAEDLVKTARFFQQAFEASKKEVADYEALGRGARALATISGKAPRRLAEDYVITQIAERQRWLQSDEGKAQLRRTAETELIMKKLIPEGTFLPGKNLSKLGTVVEGDGFNLTADTSPSGGAQLEWVVYPPCETEEDVVEVMDDITAQGEWLNARSDQESIDATGLDGVGSGANARDLLIYPQGEKLAIAPQVTGGFRLDRLDALLEYLSPGGLADQDQKDAAEDLFNNAQATGEKGTLRDTGAAARVEVEKLALPDTADREGAAARAELVGLVRLMANYLVLGSRLGSDANSKSIAGRFMSRTDFVHNFGLLAPEYQTLLSGDLEQWETLVLAAADLAGTADQKVFPRGFEKGLSGHRVHYDFPVTRGDWLRGVACGRDNLRNYDPELKKHGGTPLVANPIHLSLGGLGSVEDTVGPEDIKAIVIELRGMADNRKVEELKPLAIATFRLIESVNAGGDIRYKRTPEV